MSDVVGTTSLLHIPSLPVARAQNLAKIGQTDKNACSFTCLNSETDGLIG
ncbi:MAG: hypothetical protein NVS2B12_13520 [Ktedonobacteraceae bacterium]